MTELTHLPGGVHQGFWWCDDARSAVGETALLALGEDSSTCRGPSVALQ